MKNLANKQLYLLIFFAYLFSLIVRYLYIYKHGSNPEFLWNNAFIINTNDGYYFASGVQKAIQDMHQYNPLTPNLYYKGLTFVTTVLAKILPLSLDTIMFYMPAFVASLIAIPIILIANIYKEPLWGFFSALIVAIAWSYYNRTMLGYYDTDMFSIMILTWVVYFLLLSIKSNNLKITYIGSIFIIIYPFLYEPGRIVLYSTILAYITYIIIASKISIISLKKILLIIVSATPIYISQPYNYLISFVAVTAIYILFNSIEIKKKVLIPLAIFSLLILFYQGGILTSIIYKITAYTHTGVDSKGLKFYSTMQTVAEANGIPFFANGQVNSVANRTIGSSIAFIVSIVGYFYLLYKRKEFIILLPLIGIGIFSHWGGLRFTIYASFSLILSTLFLVYDLSKTFTKDKKMQIVPLVIVSLGLLYSNINHAWLYNKAISPVFKKSEIAQLNYLKKVSSSKDYTLSWWDYGYPIWYYTNTNTLIDGGKHNQDNYIIASILLSDSSTFAANLARVAVEEYNNATNSYNTWIKNGSKTNNIPAKYKFITKNNKPYHVGHPFNPIISTILRNNQKDQKDPNEFMATLDNPDFKLPPKTRDIYLYIPIKSIRIFPVIAQFANLDLTTGKKLRDVVFYSSYIRAIKDGNIILSNNIRVNTKDGSTNISGGLKLSRVIVAEHKKDGSIDISSLSYNRDGNLSFLYLKSLGMGIVLDNQTLNSNYVKMFLLGIYDKNLFELVDSSVYGRVYKLKR